jgi:hypothetical protein
MLDTSLAQIAPTEQTFEPGLPRPSDKDALYWLLRRENDEFLRRRQWWARHFAAGTLVSQRRRAANLLSQEGEAKAIELIGRQGYEAYPTTHKCAFDIWVQDAHGQAARVEVKTSLYKICTDPRKGGRFEANIRQHKDTDVLIFLAKNGSWWPYIIPISAIGQRQNIAIWSACPADYKGQWAIYLNAWQHLEQAIRNTQPRVWQLGFYGLN